MAAGGAPTPDYRSAVHRLLECSVCLEQYEDPRNLDCGHTFCVKCIAPLIQNGCVVCPMCRADTKLHTNSTTSLKRNIAIDNIVSIEEHKETYQSHRTDEDQHRHNVCGVCDETEVLINFCNACNLHLCRKCSKMHVKFTDCKKPDLVSIDIVIEQSRSRIEDSNRNIKDMLRKFEGVTSKVFNFDIRKAIVKTEIQSNINELLKAIETEKISLFNKVDMYYAEKKNTVVNSKSEIQKKNDFLNKLQDDLALVKQFDNPKFIDAKVKEVKTQLDAYFDYMATASVLEEQLSGDIQFTKRKIEDIQIGELVDNDNDNGRSEATFQFVLEKVSKVDVYSPKCMIRNLPWQILITPRTDCDVFGLFIVCNKDSESTTWSCRASIELKMLKVDPQEQPHSRVIDDHPFNHKNNKWGNYNFADWDCLLNTSHGYAKDDKIILEAHVTINNPQQ